MHIEQVQIDDSNNWRSQPSSQFSDKADLVFLFGGKKHLQNDGLMKEISDFYPEAQLIGCSTAGEIYDTTVVDDTIALTAIDFEHTQIITKDINIKDCLNSYDAGKKLAESIPKENLVHAFVISDGLSVNGSELVQGLTQSLPENVAVTGGLSGDGANFEETFVISDKQASPDCVSLIAFYGDRLKVGYASLGGWDTFGTERLITRAEKNVLYELDGHSALELYKTYLGEHAEGLPATGLLFPLALRTAEGDNSVVRTILSVNEQDQSLTFAGDVPEGCYAKLMKANFSRLVEGAMNAAQTSYEAIGSQTPDFAILVSCVGRKMVLKQRVEEEVEAVREILGDEAKLTGFYSYGEISPFTPGAKCELHNQTMTITTFSEH